MNGNAIHQTENQASEVHLHFQPSHKAPRLSKIEYELMGRRLSSLRMMIHGLSSYVSKIGLLISFSVLASSGSSAPG